MSHKSDSRYAGDFPILVRCKDVTIIINTNLSDTITGFRKRVFDIYKNQQIEGLVRAKDAEQIVFGLQNSALDISKGFTVINDKIMDKDGDLEDAKLSSIGLKEFGVLAFKVVEDTSKEPDNRFDVLVPEIDAEPEP